MYFFTFMFNFVIFNCSSHCKHPNKRPVCMTRNTLTYDPLIGKEISARPGGLLSHYLTVGGTGRRPSWLVRSSGRTETIASLQRLRQPIERLQVGTIHTGFSVTRTQQNVGEWWVPCVPSSSFEPLQVEIPGFL